MRLRNNVSCRSTSKLKRRHDVCVSLKVCCGWNARRYTAAVRECTCSTVTITSTSSFCRCTCRRTRYAFSSTDASNSLIFTTTARHERASRSFTSAPRAPSPQLHTVPRTQGRHLRRLPVSHIQLLHESMSVVSLCSDFSTLPLMVGELLP